MTDVEEAVLGCLAGFNADEHVKIDVLTREDFSSPDARECFDVLFHVAEINDGEIDIVLIGDYIKLMGDIEATEGKEVRNCYNPLIWLDLINKVPDMGAGFPLYMERLKERRRSHLLKELLRKELNNVNGHGNADVIKNLQDGIATIYGGSQKYDHAKVVLDAAMELQERQENGIEMRTGFRTFDDIWGGLFRKEMHVIAGDSGHFKTTLTLNLVRNPLRGGHRVLWFDGEIGQLRLMRHMVAVEAKIETWRLRKALMRDKDWKEFNKASNVVTNWPLIIMDDVSTLQKMNENILRYKPDIVVLDNIQNMDFPKSDNFWTFHMGIVGLKRMAMSHDIALVALSQVTRTPAEVRSCKPPTLENLFGSRAIKQNADCISMIYWPWKDEQSSGISEHKKEHEDLWIYHMKMREEGLAQQKMRIDAMHGRVEDIGYHKSIKDAPIPEKLF